MKNFLGTTFRVIAILWMLGGGVRILAAVAGAPYRSGQWLVEGAINLVLGFLLFKLGTSIKSGATAKADARSTDGDSAAAHKASGQTHPG
jgi:hypothetical protein